MKIIQIKYKDQIKECLVDDSDFELVSKYHWNYTHGYAYGYLLPFIKGCEMVFMHRILFGLEKGSEFEIDHKDHNRLNNQRDNIRVVNHKQNCQNTSSWKVSSSKYRGVVKKRNRKKCKDGYHYYGTRYVAKIKVKGHTKALGSYMNEIVAAKIYDKAASLVFGEYANLNLRYTENEKAINI